MNIFQIYKIIYHFIYIYIVIMCVWSIFKSSNIHDGKHHPFVRQLGYALIMAPFLLRFLGIK